jgi:hypothetical protein
MRSALAFLLVLACVAPAMAQDRPFMFSIVTAPQPEPTIRFDYDLGIGERTFQSDVGTQP